MRPADPVMAAAAGGVVCLALAGVWPAQPRWLWNTTASAPVGLYRLQRTRAIGVGDWVAIRPPATLAAWLDARGALPAGALLLKRVAALAPSWVCRRDLDIVVDGALRARAALRDRQGRPLPRWDGCRQLRSGEMFVLNAEPRSLDGRYFGVLPLSAMVARAYPTWLTRDG